MTFLDTSYFVAIALRRDALHKAAVAWSSRLRGPFLTTEYVLCEFVNRLSMPVNRPKAHAMWARVQGNERIEVVPADSRLLRAGLAFHADRTDKSWSLTDCISFVVMQEAGVNEALTHDHHFEQAGFTALLRQSAPE